MIITMAGAVKSDPENHSLDPSDQHMTFCEVKPEHSNCAFPSKDDGLSPGVIIVLTILMIFVFVKSF